jgi:hypothetical protein
MSAIGPGDFVECVDGSPLSNPKRPPVIEGAVYRVHAIKSVLAANGEAVEALLLVGLNTYPDAYSMRRFRPIYRPDEKLIRDLLQPVEEFA